MGTVNPSSYNLANQNSSIFNTVLEKANTDGQAGITQKELSDFRDSLGNKIGAAAQAGGAAEADVQAYQAADFLLSRITDWAALIGGALTWDSLTQLASRAGNKDILSDADFLPEQYDANFLKGLIDEIDQDGNGLAKADLEAKLTRKPSQKNAAIQFLATHFDKVSANGVLTKDTLFQAIARDGNVDFLSKLDFDNKVIIQNAESAPPYAPASNAKVYVNAAGAQNNRITIAGTDSMVTVDDPLENFRIKVSGNGLQVRISGNMVYITDTYAGTSKEMSLEEFQRKSLENPDNHAGYTDPDDPSRSITIADPQHQIVHRALDELHKNSEGGQNPGIDAHDDTEYVIENYTKMKAIDEDGNYIRDENGNYVYLEQHPWLVGDRIVFCASFASVMTYEATGELPPMGYQHTVENVLSWGKHEQRFISQQESLQEGSRPKTGDYILYGSDGGQHIGIVQDVYQKADGKWYVKTIEGNTSGNAVAEEEWPLEHGPIYGYVRAFGDKPA